VGGISAGETPAPPGGAGVLARIEFGAVAAGEAMLTLESATVFGPDSVPRDAVVVPGSVRVGGAIPAKSATEYVGRAATLAASGPATLASEFTSAVAAETTAESAAGADQGRATGAALESAGTGAIGDAASGVAPAAGPTEGPAAPPSAGGSSWLLIGATAVVVAAALWVLSRRL
jgi:hypothetical protein